MKKLLIALIVLMLCCFTACAETLDVNPEDLKLDLSVKHNIEVELADQAAFAQSTVDKVTRTENSYIVDNGSVTMTLDMEKYPAVLCFTQDKYASFESYLSLSPEKIDSLLAQLIKDKINFYLIDLETGMQVFIYTKEGDDLSAVVGDLATLSEENRQVLLSRVFSGMTIQEAGSTPWIIASDYALLTIANNQYVVVEFGGSGDAAADLEDTLGILSGMVIK